MINLKLVGAAAVRLLRCSGPRWQTTPSVLITPG